jgi:hypothetical protein
VSRPRKLDATDRIIEAEMGAGFVAQSDNRIPHSRVREMIKTARRKWLEAGEAARVAALVLEAEAPLRDRIADLEARLEVAERLRARVAAAEAEANRLRAQASSQRDRLVAFEALEEALEKDPAGLLKDLARVNPRISNYLSTFALMGAR